MQRITPEECAELIQESQNIVAFTGAGVSTAAGIPDFRGPNGLYVTRAYDPETVFDIDYFRRDPEPFYKFTRDFLTVLEKLQPTKTHQFLASLETEGKLRGVITQNIDPLHNMAGSGNVISVHGNYYSSHCTKCGVDFSYADLLEMLEKPEVPRCGCGGVIKPDVVFFGEAVNGLDEACALAQNSDLMLVLGSSLTVYPAAMIPQYSGGKIIVVNQSPVSLNREYSFSDNDLDDFFEKATICLQKNTLA